MKTISTVARQHDSAAPRPGAGLAAVLLVLLTVPTSQAFTLDSLRTHALSFAQEQLAASVSEVGDPTRYPRSTLVDGTWSTTDAHAWTSGFFPGCLWLIGEITGDPTWFVPAASWTAALEGEKSDTSTHDVGFKIFCSFGNAYRLLGDPADADVVLTGAASLTTRYSTVVGCTRSWDNHTFPVIVDNMMNLEILLWGAAHGGAPSWRDMAVSHALRTRTEHVRADGSTYHLVDFDPATGTVLERGTVQGSGDETTWARGQAWGLYGFTMVYRETGDPRFLATASQLADWFIEHLPADHVPYWDFEAPGIPNEEKDSSAAAIAASGLLELATLTSDGTSRSRYFFAARDILQSLCGPAYLAEGTSSRGLLLHGVGHHPGNSEIDVSLIYGDYYFLEALSRYPQVATNVAVRPGLRASLQVVPNPSRARVELLLLLSQPAAVSLRVLDVRGRVVRTFLESTTDTGARRIIWDGTESDGGLVPSGVYFCELSADGRRSVRRLTWLR